MRLKFNKIFLIIINVISIVFAAILIVLFNQIDSIIHTSLYNFGLIFNSEWAIPYWTLQRLSITFLGTIATLNVISIFYGVFSHETLQRTRKSTPRIQEAPPTGEKPINKHQMSKTRKYREKEKPALEAKDDGAEVMTLPMVCNKCGKVFTQSLCMFDFKSGKPRLVNVCPYCNVVLPVSCIPKEK